VLQRRMRPVALVAVIFAAGYAVGRLGDAPMVASAEASPFADRVFELRTYTAPEGKLEALNARFRDHTMEFFEKHDMTNVGYWTPLEGPTAENTLVYLISHESREAARANWAAFNADSGWREVSRASQVDGRIVSNVESVFLRPTDYSPIK
jgi:hypothetical protein